MTCWRRLRDRQAAGNWARLHRALPDRLGHVNAIDFGRCLLTTPTSQPQGGDLREVC
jgi:hypothetical protein